MPENKETTDDLSQQVQNLKIQIGDLQLELNESLKRERELEQFVQDVTHQLVGPLSGLKAHAENLLLGIIPSSRQDRVLETIIEQADIFQRYVRNLSLLVSGMTSLERGGPTLVEYKSRRLVELLIRTSRNFQGQTRAYGIRGPHILEESFRSFPSLFINKQLFEILIFNLLDNAVKYSFRDRQAPIIVKGTTGIEWTIIEIINYGIPISERDLSHIFERYFRSDRAIEFSPVGTGIGLYICAQIMKVHGGSIQALPSIPSKEIEGAYEVRFILTFPVRSNVIEFGTP